MNRVLEEEDSNQGNIHSPWMSHRERDKRDAETKTFLSDSFTGSRRHLDGLAYNAMEVVSERGKPTVFITATCNPEWPEIKERLIGNQSAFDRHDVVIPVFQGRLKALLQNVRNGKYFNGAVVILRDESY